MADGPLTGNRRAGGASDAERAAREALLAEVATLYYVDHLSQKQIARQISRSVATVSRLLAEAEASEIVHVRVRSPIPLVPELQEALVRQFKLRVARVIRATPEEPQRTLSNLGQLAARYLATLLTDGSVISIGWGTSVREVVRAIRTGPHRGLQVVQGLGSLGSQLPAIDNPLLTQLLATRIDGTPHFLPAPMVVENTTIRDALGRDPQLRETLDLCARSDIALVGIGPASPEHSGLCRSGYLNRWELEHIRQNGAVGDVMGEFFTIYGQLIQTDVGPRFMGMREDELRKVGVVIAVAGSVVKARAILGALRTGFIHVLVTDDETARRVIELSDTYPMRPQDLPGALSTDIPVLRRAVS